MHPLIFFRRMYRFQTYLPMNSSVARSEVISSQAPVTGEAYAVRRHDKIYLLENNSLNILQENSSQMHRM